LLEAVYSDHGFGLSTKQQLTYQKKYRLTQWALDICVLTNNRAQRHGGHAFFGTKLASVTETKASIGPRMKSTPLHYPDISTNAYTPTCQLISSALRISLLARQRLEWSPLLALHFQCPSWPHLHPASSCLASSPKFPP